MDFWVVKNVTGRILVGLRYWSEIDEEGEEIWHYESSNDDKDVGYTDAIVFWTGLYGSPIIWGFFAIMDFLSFKFFWMYVCILCFTIASTNVSGYYNCRREAYNKLRSEFKEQTMAYVVGQYMSNAVGGVKDLVFSKIPFLGFGQGKEKKSLSESGSYI